MQEAARRTVEFIGYDSGWGCVDYGCEDGPAAIPHDRIETELKARGVEAIWEGPLGLKDIADHDEMDSKDLTLPLVVEGAKRLSEKAIQAIRNGDFPLTLGGDHASAIGTWSGVVHALDAHKKFGMIWIDAHMDAHTPETAHQGKWGGWWHGMPIACLLGHGEDELTGICDPMPKLSAEHMSLIGIRSYEPAEAKFVAEHGIRVYMMDEVAERGLDVVFAEALERATGGTEGFGLSIDLDGFDPADAPGVGTCEKNGVRAAEFIPLIRGITRDERLKGAEIVEYNPHNDREQKTLALIESLIIAMLD